jgi:dipeptidyl-peptidase-4
MSALPFYRCLPLAHASLGRAAALLLVASFIGARVILGTQENDIPANGNNAGPPIRQLTAADYARAEKVLDFNLKGSVKNAQIVPHWLPGQSAFWYRRETNAGVEYLLVDALKGTKKLLFDEQRLIASILAAAPKSGVTPAHLTVNSLEQNSERRTAKIATGTGGSVTCDLDSYVCTLNPTIARPNEIISPDGEQAVFARDNNLWLRDTKTNREKKLTTMGEPYFAYGKLLDTSLVSLPQLRKHPHVPPVGVVWSPDSKKLIATRWDERKIEPYPYVEWVPQDGSCRPIMYSLRIPLPGDKDAPPAEEVQVIDCTTRQTRSVKLSGDWRWLTHSPVGWSVDNQRVFFISDSFGSKATRLVELDCVTGRVRTIIEETSSTSVWLNEYLYSPPNVRVFGGGSEAIWFSERDGWGHLYLYNVRSPSLKRQVTHGNWLVRDIIEVDERERKVYFTASGREENWDPYSRAFYSASLDGGEPTLLTPEQLDHDISAGPNVFLDTASTVKEKPVTVLRSKVDGAIIAKIESADASALYATGWRSPERVAVKAADGKTELRAVIYYPPDYRSDRKYPVIDAFYGGPQMTNAPVNFPDAIVAFNPISRASLAQLGFIVLTIDGRGTPGRSKAFHDVSYGVFADPEIEDHVAAIKELAARFGTFDLDRVGVYGHSFGGYTSARAILSHPEFYKVAVSSAGPHNFQGFYQGLENLIGLPDYGNGERTRPSPNAVPLNYKQLDNTILAAKLRGRLLLVYGDMDENALPAGTFQLADALIKANKTFDLVYLPNRTHAFFRNDAYYARRMWDYFVLHLLHAAPPDNYELKLQTTISTS